MNTPLRTLELLDKPAITGGVMELVAWRKRNPWRWVRTVPKWFVEHKQEMSKMLTVTGTAEFTNDGKLLELVVVIQPHWPAEHDMMERIVKLYDSDKVTLDQGQLVLRRTMVVPAAEVPAVAPAPEMPLESNTQSGSASEDEERFSDVPDGKSPMTETAARKFYADQPSEKKQPAIEYLRAQLQPEDRTKLQELIAADLGKWHVQHHFRGGMAVRNALREGGFGEEYWPIWNLDDIYVFVLEDAISSAPESTGAGSGSGALATAGASASAEQAEQNALTNLQLESAEHAVTIGESDDLQDKLPQ